MYSWESSLNSVVSLMNRDLQDWAAVVEGGGSMYGDSV